LVVFNKNRKLKVDREPLQSGASTPSLANLRFGWGYIPGGAFGSVTLRF